MHETAINLRRCYDCEKGALEGRNRKRNVHTLSQKLVTN